MQTFLHVGCGPKHKDQTTRGFNTPDWTEPAYTSPAGPITPLDILYGHRPPMAKGNLYMAHRCGFTKKVLTGTLHASGFVTVAAKRREHPYYDLWALGTVAPVGEAELRQLAGAHFPWPLLFGPSETQFRM